MDRRRRIRHQGTSYKPLIGHDPAMCRLRRTFPTLAVAFVALGASGLIATEASACSQDGGNRGRPACCAKNPSESCGCCDPIAAATSNRPMLGPAAVSHPNAQVLPAQASRCECEPAAPVPAHSKQESGSQLQRIAKSIHYLSPFPVSCISVTPYVTRSSSGKFAGLPLYLRTARLLI
jgi:hypothetical protein